MFVVLVPVPIQAGSLGTLQDDRISQAYKAGIAWINGPMGQKKRYLEIVISQLSRWLIRETTRWENAPRTNSAIRS